MQQAMKEIANGDEINGRRNMNIAQDLINRGKGEIMVGQTETQIGNQEMMRGQV
jgi:hypothetical protein